MTLEKGKVRDISEILKEIVKCSSKHFAGYRKNSANNSSFLSNLENAKTNRPIILTT